MFVLKSLTIICINEYIRLEIFKFIWIFAMKPFKESMYEYMCGFDCNNNKMTNKDICPEIF